MKKINLPLGDNNIILSKDDINIELKTEVLDELEYDCFDLFKKYAAAFGIEMLDEDNNEIDFFTAKTIQDAVIKIFEDAGFKPKNEQADMREDYETYKKEWVAAHINDKILVQTRIAYGRYTAYENNNDDTNMTIEEYVEKFGYADGSCYACFKEFCDNEYIIRKKDKAYAEFVESECERQWNDCQAQSENESKWSEQSDDAKKSYYNEMYENLKDRYDEITEQVT